MSQRPKQTEGRNDRLAACSSCSRYGRHHRKPYTHDCMVNRGIESTATQFWNLHPSSVEKCTDTGQAQVARTITSTRTVHPRCVFSNSRQAIDVSEAAPHLRLHERDVPVDLCFAQSLSLVLTLVPANSEARLQSTCSSSLELPVP